MVTDKTGLMGLYDWEIKFDPQVLMQIASQIDVTLPPGVNLPSSDSPSLLTVLRENLGLKRDSQRGPVEVLVIDSAEMPEAN
jgi:bla regulator protein blaR1